MNCCNKKPRTKIHKHDPTRFPNIYFSKKKAQHNFCSLRFKVSIHKVFHQHTPSFRMFHLEFCFIVQYCFNSRFQQVTQVCLQVARVFVSHTFFMHLYQQLKQYSKQNHHYSSELLLVYPLATYSYLSYPVAKSCLQP